MKPRRRSELKPGTVFKYIKYDGTRFPNNPYVYFAESRHMLQPTLVGGERPRPDHQSILNKTNMLVEVLWEPKS